MDVRNESKAYGQVSHQRCGRVTSLTDLNIYALVSINEHIIVCGMISWNFRDAQPKREQDALDHFHDEYEQEYQRDTSGEHRNSAE